MKIKLLLLTCFYVFLFIFFSCSKDDEDKAIVTSIDLTSNATNVQVGTMINFTVKTNLDQIITNDSDIYINDVLHSSSFTAISAGEYIVKATYNNSDGDFESNLIVIVVTEIPLNEIILNSDIIEGEMGQQFTFSVIGDNSSDLTSEASFFIDNIQIDSNIFSPNQAGVFIVKAEFSQNGTTFTSNIIEINVLPQATETMLFDEIVFYDGYATTVNESVPSGIIRVSNASYVTKITDETISKINDELEISVVIGALCDNYDRIGGLFLNLVNEGDSYSSSSIVERIEIGRFITPFMDKNETPDEVPYTFQVDNIAKLLNDQTLVANFDFFLEFNVFGVPYAANEQVAGCGGRNDVFRGTVIFKSRNEIYTPPNQYLKPIVTYFTFNNYQPDASDAVGQSVKTFDFSTDEDITNAQIHVVISNHGANSGGEEYERRNHFIYIDNTLIDNYVPGGESCEPYRIYNTQGNGIYGPSPRPASVWASFSNWCPGDVIPIRTYNLGNISSGLHTFKLEVPDAVFVDNQGYFPVSVYLQGEL